MAILLSKLKGMNSLYAFSAEFVGISTRNEIFDISTNSFVTVPFFSASLSVLRLNREVLSSQLCGS